MTSEIRYIDCQVIYDRDHGPDCEGWYLRYSEPGEDGQRNLDEGLDVTDPDDAEAALDAAIAWMGDRAPAREEIDVHA